jgi:hypothetical protein
MQIRDILFPCSWGSLLNVNRELHVRDSNLGYISSGALQPPFPSGEVTKHSRADLLLLEAVK